LLGFSRGARQRFLTDDMFAGRGRGNRDLTVQVVGVAMSMISMDGSSMTLRQSPVDDS